MTSLPSWLQLALEALRAGNTDGWMAIYAEDAVHEFPFAPPGRPRKLVGRTAIAAYMSQLPALLRFGTLDDVRARQVDGELIVEAVGHHQRVADGAQRVIGYVWFISHRDGLVTNFRDYTADLPATQN